MIKYENHHLHLSLTMIDPYQNAFGISKLSFSNLVANVDVTRCKCGICLVCHPYDVIFILSLLPKYMMFHDSYHMYVATDLSIIFTGTITYQKLSGTVDFGLNTAHPEKNYFMAKVKPVTLKEIIEIFCNMKLPGNIQNMMCITGGGGRGYHVHLVHFVICCACNHVNPCYS